LTQAGEEETSHKLTQRGPNLCGQRFGRVCCRGRFYGRGSVISASEAGLIATILRGRASFVKVSDQIYHVSHVYYTIIIHVSDAHRVWGRPATV